MGFSQEWRELTLGIVIFYSTKIQKELPSCSVRRPCLPVMDGREAVLLEQLTVPHRRQHHPVVAALHPLGNLALQVAQRLGHDRAAVGFADLNLHVAEPILPGLERLQQRLHRLLLVTALQHVQVEDAPFQ